RDRPRSARHEPALPDARRAPPNRARGQLLLPPRPVRSLERRARGATRPRRRRGGTPGGEPGRGARHTGARDMSGTKPTLQEQVALVTGGVRGIGRAISERLVDAGVRVAAGYSRNVDAAEQLVAELGTNVSVHQGNISSNEDCERVVEEVVDRYGRLDV